MGACRGQELRAGDHVATWAGISPQEGARESLQSLPVNLSSADTPETRSQDPRPVVALPFQEPVWSLPGGCAQVLRTGSLRREGEQCL